MSDRRLLFICASAGLFSAALLFVHRLDTGGDNLDFILLARSIQFGRWIETLGWPRPGGYSTFIAAIMRVLGYRIEDGIFSVPLPLFTWIKAFNVLFHGLLAGCLYALVRRLGGRAAVALAAGLFLAFNQTMAATATFIGAEPLFTLIAMAALLVWERDPARRPATLAVFVVMTALATNVKYQGVCLAGALVLWILVNRAWQRRFVAAAALLVVFVAGMAALQWYGNKFCLQHVVASDPYGEGRPVTWVQRGLTFLNVYAGSWADRLVPKLLGDRGLLDAVGLGIATWPLIVVIDAVLVVGFVATWRRGGFSLAHGFFACFHGLLLIWPDFLGRYLIPLVPVGTWLFVEGLAAIFQRLEKIAGKVPTIGKPERLLAAAAGAIVVWFVATDVFAGVKNWRNIVALHGQPPWAPERYRISREDDFADYIEAGQWIGEHAPLEVMVFCRKALFTELAARRACIYYSAYPSSDLLWAAVEERAAQGPCLILQDAFDPRSTYGRIREQWLMPALAAHPDRLEALHTTAGGSVIYRVR